jgi:hypothetical protein
LLCRSDSRAYGGRDLHLLCRSDSRAYGGRDLHCLGRGDQRHEAHGQQGFRFQAVS